MVLDERKFYSFIDCLINYSHFQQFVHSFLQSFKTKKSKFLLKNAKPLIFLIILGVVEVYGLLLCYIKAFYYKLVQNGVLSINSNFIVF